MPMIQVLPLLVPGIAIFKTEEETGRNRLFDWSYLAKRDVCTDERLLRFC